jgi:hypothetical protein
MEINPAPRGNATGVPATHSGGATSQRLHGKAYTARTAHLTCTLLQHGAERSLPVSSVFGRHRYPPHLSQFINHSTIRRYIASTTASVVKQTIHKYVGFEVFTDITLSIVFWIETPSILEKIRSFGAEYSLHHQGRISACRLLIDNFLLGLLSDHGDTLLRNVGLSPKAQNTVLSNKHTDNLYSCPYSYTAARVSSKSLQNSLIHSSTYIMGIGGRNWQEDEENYITRNFIMCHFQ